ncbi:MAG TPA: GGDEF domain-containing protein, partial [Bdellovibrionales bacterium]|nr:GGDEF domain-containing protein [Bdellovibrionales bacterium]
LAPLKQLLFEVFNAREYEAYPIEGDDGVSGVVVALQAIDDSGAKRLFEAMVEVLKVAHSNAALKKTLHSQSVRDALTGLLNKKAFDQKLHEEISRARRIEMPVSLISIGIDHFTEFADNNGQALADIVLKMIASLMKRTSRSIDIVARTGPAEFAVLLPHTTQTGAAVKAEKLRRLVEITKFPQRETQPGGRVTVSVGVSEYPSLSADAEGLVQSSDSAFFQVRTVTNKVCLAAPPPGLRPDFETGS